MGATRRGAVLAGVALAAATLLGACGDDEPSASERVCDERSDVRDAVGDVTSAVGEGNLGDAQEEVADLREDLGDLEAAVGDLADEEKAALDPLFDAVREDIASLAEARSLDDVSATLDEVEAGITDLVDEISGTVDCS